MLLQATEIVGRGFEYWGPFGMVIALLIAAVVWQERNRLRVVKDSKEEKAQLIADLKDREAKYDELSKETIGLLIKVEDRLTEIRETKELVGEVKVGVNEVSGKIDLLKERLVNGQ